MHLQLLAGWNAISERVAKIMRLCRLNLTSSSELRSFREEASRSTSASWLPSLAAIAKAALLFFLGFHRRQLFPVLHFSGECLHNAFRNAFPMVAKMSGCGPPSALHSDLAAGKQMSPTGKQMEISMGRVKVMLSVLAL